MKKLLTSEEVAELLQVKLSTIREWTHAEEIPFIKVGRLVRFREIDLEQWIENRKR